MQMGEMYGLGRYPLLFYLHAPPFSPQLHIILNIGFIAGMIHLHEVLYKGFNQRFCVTEMQRFAEEVLLVNQGLRTTCNCALQVTIITHIQKDSPIHARISLKFVPKTR